MADENKKSHGTWTTTATDSIEADKPIDFPKKEFLRSLLLSFPLEWRGLLAALNSEQLPIQSATLWLENKLSRSSEALSNIPPNWTNLIDSLVQDFPVSIESNLFFQPRILQLPLNIQRNALAFISHHSNLLSLELLEKLVSKLGDFPTEIDGWKEFHFKILSAKLRNLKRRGARDSGDGSQSTKEEETDSLYTDTISEESRDRFITLCEKTRIAKSSRKLPWFSQSLTNETKTNNGEIARTEEDSLPCSGLTNSDITETDNGFAKCGSHMNDKNDHFSCTHDSSCIADGFEEGHSQVTDVKIVDVVKSPVKRIKTDNCSVTTTQLKIPSPPPEHFIMDTEDVHEHFNLETERSERPGLNDGFQIKISALENLLQSSDIKEQDVTNELEVLSSCTSVQLESICTHLNLKSVSESSAVSLCQMFVSIPVEPSFRNAAVFASHCLLPKIHRLQQAVSRQLLNAVFSFANRHSRAFCDGVIIKLVCDSNLGVPQADVVNRVIKDYFNGDTRVYLLEQILVIKSDSQGLPFTWSENTVSIVQTIIDFKPGLSRDLFATFIMVLEKQSGMLSKSLKFGKLMLAVINKYCEHIASHYNSFLRIIEGNNTFFKKAGLSALKKAYKIKVVTQ